VVLNKAFLLCQKTQGSPPKEAIFPPKETEF
jgi:hypothetical protein